jgi:uncharacterized coiled-coil protein SlyX
MRLLKFFTALLVIFASVTSVQAQIEVLSTGAVKIGSSSSAKITSTADLLLDVPTIKIGGGDSLGFKIYTYNPGISPASGTSSETSLIGGSLLPPVIPGPPTQIYLTGYTSNNINIGSIGTPITNVYAKHVYESGSSTGVLSASDVRLKKNITKISSVGNKIKSLNVVKYDFTKTLGGEDVSNDPAYKNKTGLLAQEVKDIFPDVVYYNEIEAFYALDYTALIPYLIKSDQEQQEFVSSLEEKVVSLEDIVASQQELITSLQDKSEMQEQIIAKLQKQFASIQKQSSSKAETPNRTHKLFQNAPNPFNQSTKIEYVLSENANNAKLCIYDLNGKQLRCFNLNTTKGASSIEVRASDLNAGIYLYTLIVDNMPIDTKRMILTE